MTSLQSKIVDTAKPAPRDTDAWYVCVDVELAEKIIQYSAYDDGGYERRLKPLVEPCRRLLDSGKLVPAQTSLL